MAKTLRGLEAALANASGDRIVSGQRAAVLRSDCRRYAARLTPAWHNYAWPISFVVDAINERRRTETLVQARLHVKKCLDFLQEAIADDAAVLADDASLEERVAATIETFAASTITDESSST